MITKLRATWMLSGMQQGTIARELGVSQSKVSEWMSGIVEIPRRRVPELCLIFRCNPVDIIGWTDEVLERNHRVGTGAKDMAPNNGPTAARRQDRSPAQVLKASSQPTCPPQTSEALSGPSAQGARRNG